MRWPDPCANPYLLFAAVLAAGLQGIRDKETPGPYVEKNILRMSEEERENLGLENLPENLSDAIKSLEEDEFVKNVLGEKIAGAYIRRKKKEWQEYRTMVTQWEIDSYLHKF